ncbi:MAG: siphovirus Gp157 family protein [Candidatus Omnitrophota bacterium]
MKLYEISQQYEEIMAELEGTEGALTPEIQQRLDAVEDDLKRKVENIACLIRQFQADGETCKSESERLTALRKSRERAAEGLKAYALGQLQRLGLKKVETELFVVSRQANPERVVIDDENELPGLFFTAKLTMPFVELPEELRPRANREPDKTLIKKFIEAHPDAPIPGVHLEAGESLRIR